MSESKTPKQLSGIVAGYRADIDKAVEKHKALVLRSKKAFIERKPVESGRYIRFEEINDKGELTQTPVTGGMLKLATKNWERIIDKAISGE